MTQSAWPKIFLVCISLLLPRAAFAQDARFEVGLRGNIAAASGEPATDIPGYGIFARYRLNERWSIGAACDRSEYDFETPAKVLGLRHDPGVDPVDAVAKDTTLSAWLPWNLPEGQFTQFGQSGRCGGVPPTAARPK